MSKFHPGSLNYAPQLPSSGQLQKKVNLKQERDASEAAKLAGQANVAGSREYGSPELGV